MTIVIVNCGEKQLITPTYRVPKVKPCKVVFDKHGNILKRNVGSVKMCVKKLRLSEQYYYDNSMPLPDEPT